MNVKILILLSALLWITPYRCLCQIIDDFSDVPVHWDSADKRVRIIRNGIFIIVILIK